MTDHFLDALTLRRRVLASRPRRATSAPGVIVTALAWMFIVLAACPFTAPFAACDLSSLTASGGVDLSAPGAVVPQYAYASFRFSTRHIARRQGENDAQLRDDEEQFSDEDYKDVDVSAVFVLEIQTSKHHPSPPPLHQKRHTGFAVIALRV